MNDAVAAEARSSTSPLALLGASSLGVLSGLAAWELLGSLQRELLTVPHHHQGYRLPTVLKSLDGRDELDAKLLLLAIAAHDHVTLFDPDDCQRRGFRGGKETRYEKAPGLARIGLAGDSELSEVLL
ncbi:MAG: hypothetical protein MUQ65_03425 [Armatimonadetes bacterium]|nr:hypothetical protein [Armatimonadota bacterium]